MLFTSLDFAIFLPIVFVLYWWIGGRNPGLQNKLIVLASYIFYGWWDWRFLALIFLTSLIDFVVANRIHATDSRVKARALLLFTLTANIGMVAVFKYYNFFAAELNAAWTFFGYPPPLASLNLILPVGISFYTFQSVSYSIDVYRGHLKPTGNLFTYLGFVSFFPQLVAGPIERATQLLPQFQRERHFSPSEARDGMRQILWGLFKKMAVADVCAGHANHAFDNSSTLGSAFLVIGAVMFAFQIYGDFSGYTDIAIGTAKLFGFKLCDNFAFPYFSRDIGEFWRRWHMSLSTWFRDYIYLPLGGSRVGTLAGVRNIFVVFLISGLWHGANWTFIAWGGLNAAMFIPLYVMKNHRQHVGPIAENRILPGWREALAIATTFATVVVLWIFFRAESLSHAFVYIGRMATEWANLESFYLPKVPFATIAVMLGFEWFHRSRKHGLQFDTQRTRAVVRWCAYYALIATILMVNSPESDFIYFQF